MILFLAEIMKCPKLKDIEHGWVTVNFVQSVYFGRYNCIPGYKLDGAWFRSCTDGQWEGTAPACVEGMKHYILCYHTVYMYI
jgi:hypothetical protein